MKILTYQQINALQETLPTKKVSLFSEHQLNLASWQNEVIAILGPRPSSKAFFENLKRQTCLADWSHSTQQSLNNLEDPQYLLNFSETLYENIYKGLEASQPHLGVADKLDLTEQYINAAYLQPYANNLPSEVSKLVNKQAILALHFAASSKIILLPDVFCEVNFSEKALLQRIIQNLRYLQKQSPITFFQTQQPDEAIYLADRILVLTNEPANVIGDSITINFNEPRNRWIISQLPAFKKIRKRLISLLTDAYANEDLFIYNPSQIIS